MRALLTSVASAGRALATVLGGRALACNSSPQCCGGACPMVFRVYPCQPYAGQSGECPDPGPLWVCSDAVYSDGQPVNTLSPRRLTYSGLCYAPGGGIGQPEDLTPTGNLPPGTNILNTGDFGFTDGGCEAPECGSVRTFIRANLCSGELTAGSTITQAWVCAGQVALKGCGTIKRGSSDAEPWLCWLVSPSSEAVDEDDIGTSPDILKVFDDYDPDPRGCCFCVAGCVTATGILSQCVNGVLGNEPLTCCCDGLNYRISVTGYGTQYEFFDQPPATFTTTLVRPGVITVIGGVVQPDSVTTIVRDNSSGQPVDIDIGYPHQFCAGFTLGTIPPVGTVAGGGSTCSGDFRDDTGQGDVNLVTYTHACGQQGIRVVVKYYQVWGNDPNPRIRAQSTYFYSIVRESITTARCSGECPPTAERIARRFVSNRIPRLSNHDLIRLANGEAV